MARVVIHATVKIVLDSNLSTDDTVSQFYENCVYDFPDTADVRVIDTDWFDVDMVKTNES